MKFLSINNISAILESAKTSGLYCANKTLFNWMYLHFGIAGDQNSVCSCITAENIGNIKLVPITLYLMTAKISMTK